ncbi:hypothetical protein TOPH_04153 [Tolypocladium ophioglossoides CBS 100239]|uniref:Nascent polypeptide-associated complex subunit alpha-like UBA domain-containing protein n=1 Tax=Tolypocladium ophioglossoides (strain CBS 100239) TaxID=1163406 RepID=A0A0L0NBZ9_TOLOC|nr:hypothetical protein TOPH_04153 [Tolypocladium ophioglossoides CBS 100239]
MADKQPPTVVEGATGDVDDELPAAKSAEDRKAASALASLDANNDDAAAARDVDQEAVNKAMKSHGGAGAAAASKTNASAAKAAPTKNVKVDAADVALVVDQLELTRAKATELLKAHDGDAVKAMRGFISA